jgi:HEAT repeat protein
MSFMNKMFGPPDIEKLKTNQDINGLIKALTYKKDAQIRQSAYETLKKIGNPAVKPLAETLKHKDREVRKNAAKLLGEIGDPWASSRLYDASDKEEDAGVRCAAIEALGEIDDDQSRFMLKTILWYGRTADMRAAASVALAKIGPPVMDVLIYSLEFQNAMTRYFAASALGKIGDPGAVEPLKRILGDVDGPTRAAAVEALGEIGDPSVVEELIGTLSDPYLAVREKSTQALIKIGAPAAEALTTALENLEEDARKSAEEVLQKINDSQK